MACLPRPLLASLLLGMVCSLHAAEEENKPADNSITANRKDLEALRMDHGLSPEQKLALPPGLDAPVMPGPAAPPPPPDSLQKQTGEVTRKGKSAGWLIDAMESGRPARDSSRSGRYDELESRDSRTPKNPDDARANPYDRPGSDPRLALSAAGREIRPDKKTDGAMPNPLTGYMTTWMTPGDAALLLKPAGTGGKFQSALPDFTGEASVTAGGRVLAFDRTAPAVAEVSGLNPASARPTNPYLQPLNGNGGLPLGIGRPAESGQSPGLEPMPGPVMPRAPSALLPPRPEPGASRTTPYVPENFKKPEDAKYFPQLKRF